MLQIKKISREWLNDSVVEFSGFTSSEPWMDWSADQYLKDLPGKWDLSICAELEGQVVGYALCSKRNGWLWLHRLAVSPDFRGKKVGDKLIDALRPLRHANALKGIVVKTPLFNPRAIAFYERCGFSRIQDINEHAALVERAPNHKFTVGIHQPNYIPWLGYFYKMYLSDAFVFLDDVSFPTRSYVSRNMVCVGGRGLWLTVPLNRSQQTPINQAMIDRSMWKDKQLKTIEQSYRKSAFFQRYYPGIEALYRTSEAVDLATFNIDLITQISRWLGIDPIAYRSSEMQSSGMGDDRLVSLVKPLGGDVYISGSGGANYQSEETFTREGISLVYSRFAPQEYPQASPEFIPGLSVVDALFNIGDEGILDIFERLRSQRAC